MYNQAFFTRIRIWREERAEGELAEPFAGYRQERVDGVLI